jgi:DNA-directed RNA polymerase II subunit RPB2
MAYILHYPQKPLVSTMMAEFMKFDEMPHGVNVVVAIMPLGGYNQEDSMIMHKGALDNGLFTADGTRTTTDVEKKRDTYTVESIRIPPNTTKDKSEGDSGYFKRKNGNYSLLNPKNAVVREGVIVRVGDVIIGKVLVTGSKNGSDTITDCSVRVKSGEAGMVRRVDITITPDGYKMVNIVISSFLFNENHRRGDPTEFVGLIPEIGDKFASRAAQKGTVGAIVATVDMPRTAEGIIPDIIINPAAIPSRMTVNQVLETVLGKACALDGGRGDATAFGSNSTNGAAERICERLKNAGLKSGTMYGRTGLETMYSGTTGEMIEAQIFIGPTYYQRLKHLVDKKVHARSSGVVTTMTRQPLEGRSRGGGLRVGEMERDCMIGHGAAGMLKERLFDCSDPFQIDVCNKCGAIAAAPTGCHACSNDSTTTVNFPFAAKLLVQLLQCMQLKVAVMPED